jgi:outer membrane protein insertion porin family
MSKHYVIAPFIWIFFVIVFTWVNTYPSVVHAGPVGNININGAKTRPDVIRFFMDTKEGEEFDPARFANDIQRLKNTGLFYDISSDIQEKDGRRNITLSLTNKFSFIPIFKFKQGGGTSILTLGAYEVNYLDRMLEIGAQYERMSGKNGFVAWFRHPYFLSSKNRVGVEIYDHIFTLPLLTLEGEEEAFFDNNQSQWTIFIERRVKENLLAGLALNYYTNKFTPDNSTADKTTRNTQFNTKQELHDGTTISARPRLVLGRINADRFYVKGTKLSFSVEVAENAIGSDFSFIKGLIHLTSAFRPREKINIATQFKLGSKSGEEFQHKFYLGGLDSIRGFFDGQFRGEHMWVANIEFRSTLVEKTKWVVQHNVFADLGKTWDDDSFGLDGFSSPFVSFGMGFRIILPRIYRAVLRIDGARTQEPSEGFGFNFGLQQFF